MSSTTYPKPPNPVTVPDARGEISLDEKRVLPPRVCKMCVGRQFADGQGNRLCRVKTDKIDATILAKLHASGFLPEVWVADDETQRRRRQISEGWLAVCTLPLAL